MDLKHGATATFQKMISGKKYINPYSYFDTTRKGGLKI